MNAQFYGWDCKLQLPIFVGKEAYRKLWTKYGVPNTCPTDAEVALNPLHALFKTKRRMFVDDDKGVPAALWVPEEGE